MNLPHGGPRLGGYYAVSLVLDGARLAGQARGSSVGLCCWAQPGDLVCSHQLEWLKLFA